MFEVDEKDSAAYVQADFKGSNWAGNVGLRYVHTDEYVLTYTGVSPQTPGSQYSDFGTYIGVPTSHAYNDFLPSANLKFDLTPDLVGRLFCARRIHDFGTAGWPQRAGQRLRRQSGLETDSLDQFGRRYRMVLRKAVDPVRNLVLYGFA